MGLDERIHCGSILWLNGKYFLQELFENLSVIQFLYLLRNVDLCYSKFYVKYLVSGFGNFFIVFKLKQTLTWAKFKHHKPQIPNIRFRQILMLNYFLWAIELIHNILIMQWLDCGDFTSILNYLICTKFIRIFVVLMFPWGNGVWKWVCVWERPWMISYILSTILYYLCYATMGLFWGAKSLPYNSVCWWLPNDSLPPSINS